MLGNDAGFTSLKWGLAVNSDASGNRREVFDNVPAGMSHSRVPKIPRQRDTCECGNLRRRCGDRVYPIWMYELQINEEQVPPDGDCAEHFFLVSEFTAHVWCQQEVTPPPFAHHVPDGEKVHEGTGRMQTISQAHPVGRPIERQVCHTTPCCSPRPNILGIATNGFVK